MSNTQEVFRDEDVVPFSRGTADFLSRDDARDGDRLLNNTQDAQVIHLPVEDVVNEGDAFGLPENGVIKRINSTAEPVGPSETFQSITENDTTAEASKKWISIGKDAVSAVVARVDGAVGKIASKREEHKARDLNRTRKHDEIPEKPRPRAEEDRPESKTIVPKPVNPEVVEGIRKATQSGIIPTTKLGGSTRKPKTSEQIIVK